MKLSFGFGGVPKAIVMIVQTSFMSSSFLARALPTTSLFDREGLEERREATWSRRISACSRSFNLRSELRPLEDEDEKLSG